MKFGSRFGFKYKTFSRGDGTVEVHLLNGSGIIGKAKCNDSAGDKFSFKTGKDLALRRALGQWYGNQIAETERLKEILWADRIEMEDTLGGDE